MRSGVQPWRSSAWPAACRTRRSPSKTRTAIPGSAASTALPSWPDSTRAVSCAPPGSSSSRLPSIPLLLRRPAGPLDANGTTLTGYTPRPTRPHTNGPRQRRSAAAEVAHEDLVGAARAAERGGRVEHDVGRVEAHARVAAAARERLALRLDRLCERD